MNRTKQFYIVEWWEHDEGKRPDGYSVHLTKEDSRAFTREYYKEQMKMYGGRIFVRPLGEFITYIGPKTFSSLITALEQGKKGYRIFGECEEEFDL